ncbi:hypothetical protein [Marinobacter daepoensis]|uniref:hypothetical protein n=1 Tax=Marinobacter daepoensis TaxID=262077 RepID=UPI00041FFA4A|nr:hypothetical protein [Marinobacter daepoensis]
MHVAFLFDSDDPKYNGFYGVPIRNEILGTNVLQESGRHMKVYIGDVLTFSKANDKPHYVELSEKIYFSHKFQKLDVKRIRDTYFQKTIFVWVIENITTSIANRLHEALKTNSAYLGMHGVELAFPLHLVFYRNLIGSQYRLLGDSTKIFYTMNEEDGKDHSEIDALKSLGFKEVEWEDNGARQTIFDDFDTPEHFKQVFEFKKAISPYLQEEENEASELAMLLEDLNPKLFDTLGAAVRAANRAVNEEDYAHVGLSGRRFFEKMANVLFPPQKDLFKGRKVGKSEYKNRLIAFIDASVTNSDDLLRLGKETDRLIEAMNSALHGDPDPEKIMQDFADIAILSVQLLSLDPEKSRDPYHGYNKNLESFLFDVLGIDNG